MNAVRIHRKLDSETLYLPELRPLLGKTVEIVVSDTSDAATSDEFYSFASRRPRSEAEWTEQLAKFRTWRTDARFELFWPIIDRLLTVDFAHTQSWAAAEDAARDLEGYDFNAWRVQRDYDLKHAGDHLP